MKRRFLLSIIAVVAIALTLESCVVQRDHGRRRGGPHQGYYHH